MISTFWSFLSNSTWTQLFDWVAVAVVARYFPDLWPYVQKAAASVAKK